MNPSSTPQHVLGGELKPCPFCGGEEVKIASSLYAEFLEETEWGVICASCGVYVDRPDQAEAITAWNTRASDPTPSGPTVVVPVEPTGRYLYEAFWSRQPGGLTIPFDQQAAAIVSMWNAIAADAAAPKVEGKTGVGEPVGWGHIMGGHATAVFLTEDQARRYAADYDDCVNPPTVEALYTAPASSPSVGVLERVKSAVDAYLAGTISFDEWGRAITPSDLRALLSAFTGEG